MTLLNQILTKVPEFEQLLAAMDNGQCPAAVSGLSAVHRAHFAAAIRARTGQSVVVICADESESERMAKDLSALTGENVPVLSSRSFTFHNAATVSRQWEHRRLALMRAMLTEEVPVLVCTVEGLLQRTLFRLDAPQKTRYTFSTTPTPFVDLGGLCASITSIFC